MSSKAMSLKGRINHYAKQNGIAAQVVLQNFMFERFLERLSLSEYRQKFVIKGGMLVTAIVGIDTRATMDPTSSKAQSTGSPTSSPGTIKDVFPCADGHCRRFFLLSALHNCK